MNPLDARFAPLAFDYDRKRAFEEAFDLLPQLEVTRFVHPPEFSAPFMVEDAPVGAMDMTHTWRSIGLTWVPGDELTKGGRGSRRNRHVEDEWIWRDDVHAPYLRELVERLPIERMLCVRLVVLLPGCVGSVHNDDLAGLYYPSGARSVTLNLASGGAMMRMLHDGEFYDVSDHPAFLFRDDCWHGVPRVERVRIQMRVNAFFSQRMAELIGKPVLQ